MKTQFILIAIVLLQVIVTKAQVFVAWDATGTNDGTSWANAYDNLQEAIDNSPNGSQLWVKAGTYTPDRDTSGNTSPSDPRTMCFYMKAHCVSIYGGFDGSETILADRDFESNPTILSGEIGSTSDSTDNCYTIFWSANITISGGRLLDGFKITGAYGVDFSGSYRGAVTLNVGMVINNCEFYDNTSYRGGGLAAVNTNVIADNLIFHDNRSTDQGGGVYLGYNNGICSIKNSKFYNNSSNYGGALKIEGTVGSNPHQVSNCIFYDNDATYGGALQFYNTDVNFSNCTFYNNNGYGNVAYFYSVGTIDFKNSILWNSTNNVPFAIGLGNGPGVNNSIVRGGYGSGTAIISDAPIFMDSVNSDFRLRSCSPGVDEGNDVDALNSTDFAGNVRIAGGAVDMGAYEYIPVTISQSNGVLTANNGVNVAYQWIDCDNGNTLINGANSINYTPSIAGNYAVQGILGGCTDLSDCYYFDPASSGIEEELRSIISIYPNPADLFVNILLKEPGSIEIYNSIGTKVHQDKGAMNYAIDLSEWPNGVYLIFTESGDTNKFIKQ